MNSHRHDIVGVILCVPFVVTAVAFMWLRFVTHRRPR